MTKEYYIGKRYYDYLGNHIDRYWDGDGFSIYEIAAKKYTSLHKAAAIAYMLSSIANIQDEQSVKYVVYTIRNDSLITCMEVGND
jgi:hypothetical protein